MSHAVVLGDVMADVVVRLSRPVAPGSDSPVRIAFRGGGQAANSAVWLAAAGVGVTLIGRVGDDAPGRQAAAELTAAGVDARLAVDRERATGACVVMVGSDGERTMLPDPGANDALDPGDLPDDLPALGRHLHVAGYALLREGSRPAARAAIDRALAARMSVSVDPSSAALLDGGFPELARGAGLLLPNRAEAEVLSGEADPERAARSLASRVPEVVVTLGAEGALWTDGGELVRVAAEPARVSDSTGAGDAFAAGLIAARLGGADPSEFLAAGARLAARALAAGSG